MSKNYIKRCECNGGLGGDGWATEKWRGTLVCKECVRRDKAVARHFDYNHDFKEDQKCFKRRESKSQYIYE